MLAQDLVKPEFTAKTYVPETPTEKMKNAQARTPMLQAARACCSCISKPASLSEHGQRMPVACVCDACGTCELPVPLPRYVVKSTSAMWRFCTSF